jgi:aryl-alcohol dehydrogenase-like predicted oxidoreductase
MQRIPLGGSGPALSAVALGGHEYLPDGRSRGFNENRALAVTPGHVGPGYGGERRRQLLACAYELGINVFDVTIDSEKEALGRNLREVPPPYEVFVQTRPEGMCYGYDPGNRKLLDLPALRAEVQRALLLLRREAIDLFNVGLLDDSIDNDPHYLPQLAHNLQALRREGSIRYAVADSHSGERLYLQMLACGAFDAVNLDLNVGDPNGLLHVVPAARAAGLHVIAREAMLKGAWFRIGAAAGITDRGLLARIAVKWLGRQRPDCIILGAGGADELRSNVEALESGPLTPAETQVLQHVCACDAFRTHAADKARRFFGPAFPAGDAWGGCATATLQ